MSYRLRAATAADQKTITAMVRGAGLNPLDLKWQHFLVADEAGEVIGVGQVRHHGGAVRELASLVVAPGRQGEGIGAALVRALMAREQGIVYLFCQDSLEGYYARFGFAVTARSGLPGKLRLWHLLGNTMASVASRLGHQPFRVLAMSATAPLGERLSG